jgi:acetylglutamate kinase
LIQALINAPEDYIPVIAPIGVAEDGRTYNINADTAAGAIAKALSAKRFLLLSDVPGVLDKDGELIREMSAEDARKAIKDGVATGGMIPKLETCITAVDHGVEAAVILDGRSPHVLLMELFTDYGAGTLIKAD